MEHADFAVQIKNCETGKTDWVHRRHVRKVKPRPDHLDFDSDDETDFIVQNPIADSSIENSGNKPVPDSSTGGGVAKVDSSDLKRLFDEPESKPKTKRVRKPKNIVEPSRRSTRTRRSPDRLKIQTTKGGMINQTYASVVAGL